jgi:hypothetical protein
MSDEHDKPDEQKRFWATWLPWRILYLVGYGALCVYALVRFWRPPIDWLWWAILAGMAYSWILFATRIAREFRSIRRPPERIDF